MAEPQLASSASLLSASTVLLDVVPQVVLLLS